MREFFNEELVTQEYLQCTVTKVQFQQRHTSLCCANLYRSVFRTRCNQMT